MNSPNRQPAAQEPRMSPTIEDCPPDQATGRGALTRRELVVLHELRAIYRKIGVSTRAEAAAWAREHGI